MTARILSAIPALVRQIVASFVGPARIEDDTRLDALRLDSLHRIGIACELDETFHVDVPDDDIAEWSTVGDLARTVARLKGLPA